MPVLTIIPSLIASSQSELDKRYKKISSISNIFHLDIMDGLFVPHTSLEFEFTLSKNSKYEAHLMVSRPQAWLVHNHSKIHTVIVHYESHVHVHEFIQLAKKYKKKVGIAINPETPTDAVHQYLHIIDKVLVMTVHPGAYGSSFLASMLHKVNTIRSLAPKLVIEVDGGICPHTIAACKEAGANEFVVGSHFQKAASPKKAFAELTKIIQLA